MAQHHVVTLSAQTVADIEAADPTQQATLASSALAKAIRAKHTSWSAERCAESARALIDTGSVWISQGGTLVGDDLDADLWKAAPMLLPELPSSNGTEGRASLRAFASELRHAYEHDRAQPRRTPMPETAEEIRARLGELGKVAGTGSEAERCARSEEMAQLHNALQELDQ